MLQVSSDDILAPARYALAGGFVVPAAVNEVTLRPTVLYGASLAFDTHKFVTRLTGAGMSAEQAAVLAETYAALITDRLATRDDVAALREDMDREFAAVRGEIAVLREDMDREFAALREDMDREFAAVRGEIAALREEMSREFAARQAESQKDRAVLRSEIYARIAYGNLATIITLSAVMGVLLQLFG